jgi:hypothetical protein
MRPRQENFLKFSVGGDWTTDQDPASITPSG